MEFLTPKNNKAEKIARELLREGVQPLIETQTEKPNHKHEWELLSKTTAPPRHDIPQTNFEKDILDRMLFGVTVFLWECLVCRILRKESVLGSDVTQLDELIDKADKYGPQYVQRADGITFVVAKYTNQNPSTIPLR